MPRNIEIKTRMADLAAARAAVMQLGAAPLAVEQQTDRYYTLAADHRVKLRSIVGGRAELIEYRRPEATGVRASDYTVTPVRDEAAGLCLVPKGTPLVVVRKRREILLHSVLRVLRRRDGQALRLYAGGLRLCGDGFAKIVSKSS